MKKLHNLILRAFIGPFLVVFSVLVLIFLIRFVLLYIEELTGKGLPVTTYLELFFYFSFNSIPRILPLAILFSSLMTYGNMGQHNELTAIKSAGVSLLKVLTPLFVFSILIAGVSFYLNNDFIPKVNLKAYQLLWDIKHKKAAFNLKEGVFYNDIPGYSMKVNKIYPDGKSLKNVIIYDHKERSKGNSAHIAADSGYMQLMNDDSFLVLELFNGKRNEEHYEDGEINTDDYIRSDFTYAKMTFDLVSFQLDETPESLFSENRQMMNVDTLQARVDSFESKAIHQRKVFKGQLDGFFRYGILTDSTVEKVNEIELYTSYDTLRVMKSAMNRAKNVGYQAEKKSMHINSSMYNKLTYEVEKIQKYSQAIACIIMFLIGAPIGAVLKKGGLGMPGVLTILFFIVYYVIFITFEKYARGGELNVFVGGWGAILVLFPFGLFFVYQASIDSNLFDFDIMTRLNKIFKKKNQ